MLLFDENCEALILDNIHSPTNVDHFWVLDLSIMDFTLTPLLVLEEIICPTIQLRILGFNFLLPSTWNILVMDDETMQLDVVEVAELAGREFRAFTYGPSKAVTEGAVISVTDYTPSYVNVGPSLNKYQMLCHPIAPQTWINVSPSDTYNKYLKNAVAGDLV